MATSVEEQGTLPRFIVIKSIPYSEKGNAYFKGDDGSVLVGEEDVFSTLVKIEVERSTTNAKYVNLRFGYFNRYCQKKENGVFVVAESEQPEEDVSKPSCTLFEAVKVDDIDNSFYLRHVQSGGRVSVAEANMGLYVDEGSPEDERYLLTFVDWNTLVKLPSNIAFKGDNGKFVAGTDNLAFTSDDPNSIQSSYIVELKPDGHVQVGHRSLPGIYWSISQIPLPGVLPIDFGISDLNRFWPIKLDENSIALRSADNNNFCCQINGGLFQDILSASATSITKEAILQVQESVLSRNIYNVVYQMEYARIFNEAPYLAGSSTLHNEEDEEATMEVSIEYSDERSYTFSRSVSLTAGVSASIEAGLPFIEKATITVNYEINGTFQWDDTVTTTKSITATGTVPVPGKRSVKVDYVGTRGTCNIPYHYTQEDRSSIDGQIIYTDLVDGIYTGVNYYNFDFQVTDVTPP